MVDFLHGASTMAYAVVGLFFLRFWYRTHDRLFLDEDVYTYKLADLVASSAYWVGAFELGEEAAQQRPSGRR